MVPAVTSTERGENLAGELLVTYVIYSSANRSRKLRKSSTHFFVDRGSTGNNFSIYFTTLCFISLKLC